MDSRADSDIPEIPPSSDRTPEILQKALSGLSSRYDWMKMNIIGAQDKLWGYPGPCSTIFTISKLWSSEREGLYFFIVGEIL